MCVTIVNGTLTRSSEFLVRNHIKWWSFVNVHVYIQGVP